jgi:hypothetical protein
MAENNEPPHGDSRFSCARAQRKENEYICGTRSLYSFKAVFYRARQRIAHKLANPRLLEIHFHTLRHWKATMEYHKTKDSLHVKEFLGHKEIDNTLVYISLDKKLFQNMPEDSFTTRIAHNVQQACEFIEAGFEYVTGDYSDGGKIFRRRK